MTPFIQNHILCERREGLSSSQEERVVQGAALVRDIPLKRTDQSRLKEHQAALCAGAALPVGSISYLREAMRLSGVLEPENFSYPRALDAYLHRTIETRRAGQIVGEYFVKPKHTKVFTGCVFNTLDNPEHLSAHDRIQYQAFSALSPEEPVWVCAPVRWLNEARYYVLKGELLGSGLYGEYPDEAPQPDPAIVLRMIDDFTSTPGAPSAFALDVGVLSDGHTALVECTDAWAVGYYKGSLSAFDYLRFLSARWAELLDGPASLHSSRTHTKEK